MAESDFMNDLLTSNPNEPATKGHIILLRAETKSEFKALNVRIDKLEQKVDQLSTSLELIAQNVATILARLS